MNEQKKLEWQIALDSTVESINRTRRTLVVLIGIACLSIFHLYMWYGSWELARIAGRRALIHKVEEAVAQGAYISGSESADIQLLTSLKQQLEQLERIRSTTSYTTPLLGFSVSGNDLSIALQLMGVAVLLWLIFNQKRLNFCLSSLERRAGWGIPLSLFEFNFGLIGSPSDRFMRVLGRGLPLALPLASLVFVLTDIFDLYSFRASTWQRYAFENIEYRTRVMARLASGLSLGLLVLILGLWSLREWLRTEKKLTKFSEISEGIESQRGVVAK